MENKNQQQQQERKTGHILAASSLASVISAISTNPLEVIKVRQQAAHQKFQNYKQKKLNKCELHFNNSFGQFQRKIQHIKSEYYTRNGEKGANSFENQFSQQHRNQGNFQQKQDQKFFQNFGKLNLFGKNGNSNNNNGTNSINVNSNNTVNLNNNNNVNNNLKKNISGIPKYEMCSQCQCYQLNSKISINNNFLSVFKKILVNEGAKTFFSGLKFSIVMTSVNNINYFFFYEKTKQILEKTLKLKESSFLAQQKLKTNNNKIQQDESKYYAQNNKNALFYFSSALIARGITTSITLPLEYLRMLEIGSQKNNQVSSLFKNLKNLSFKERFRSLFSGYKITMQRDLSFSGIYWALVEKTRYNLDQLINSRLVENEVERILLINTVTGMLCGSVTSVLTLPLDNLKTRIQLEKKKKNDLVESRKISNSTIKQLYWMEQQEGFKSLFVGIGPRITKAASHCAIYLSLYEIFLNVLQKKDCFY